VSEAPSATTGRPRRVYLFGTCLIDLFFPDAGVDTVRLLEREGLEVVYPREQTCCGQPAYNSGYHDEARTVARRQVGLFPGDDPVIVPSGSCASMFRHHYLDLFRGEPEFATVESLSARVYELTEFLVRVLDVRLEDLGTPRKVALHTSCHARREMGVAGDAEQLLDRLGNVERVDFERQTECCGFGGTFAVKHAPISAAMVSDKADAITAASPDQLVGGDCGCLMNIGGALDKRGSPIRIQHIASLLWERTDESSGS
jgi:L-lactate dehydrogenase complex protein LldE